MKKCSKCLEDMALELFSEYHYKDGTPYRSICKQCKSKIQVKRRREKGLSPERKEKFKAYKAEWKKKNKAKLTAKERDRYHSDVHYKLKKRVSFQIRFALKNNGSKKYGKSCLKFLGYTIEDLKKHIESLFDANMSWANHGIYWHIDHIIPQSLLPYTSMEDESFKKCWSLENIRPLEAKQNMSDGATKVRHKLYANGDL
jgi:hypothetical protein